MSYGKENQEEEELLGFYDRKRGPFSWVENNPGVADG